MLRIARRTLCRIGGPLSPAHRPPRPALGWRHGALVRLTDEAGNTGAGEASPLPGYSHESLDDCERALGSLELDRLVLDEEGLTIEELAALSAPLSATPAARFALETALVDLVSRRRGEPAWRALAGLAGRSTPSGDGPEVRLSSLLPAGAPERVLEAAADALGRGIRTLKLKIGAPDAWPRERVLLAALRAELGDAVELRLDANQAWPAALASERLAELAGSAPEFVEEPVSGLARPSDDGRAASAVLCRSTAPVALDESLACAEAPELVAALSSAGAPLVVLVLKPTFLGGFCRALELAGHARSLGLDLVVTHTFDGPVALTAAAALALALGGPRAAGLGPHAALSAYPALPLPAHGRHSLRGWSEPGFGATTAEVPG